MPEFSDISVRILSDVTQLRAGMAQAQASLQRVESATSSLRGAWNLLQTALTAYGFSRVASAMYAAGQALDETSKSARRLGMSTAEMQAFRLAAEYSGVSISQAERAMTRLTAEIARGTGPAAEALRALGLSAGDIDTDDLSASLYTVLSALRDVSDPAERARLALDMFGRGGAQMIELASGVDQAREAIDRLGMGFSDDAASGVEVANDSITTLGASIQALLAGLYADAAPVLQAHAEAWAEIVSWLNRARAGYENTAAATRDAAQAQADALAAVGGASETPGSGLSDMLREMEALAPQVERMREEADRIRERMATPLERAQADAVQAALLNAQGFLDDETMARVLARVDEEYQRLAEEQQRALDEMTRANDEAARQAEEAWRGRLEGLGVPDLERQLDSLMGEAARVTISAPSTLGSTTDPGAARFLGEVAVASAAQQQVSIQQRIAMLVEQIAYRRHVAMIG